MASGGACVLAGDHAKSAEVYRELGALPPEADARMRLAQALADRGKADEAGGELQRALAFWRSVEATAYVREAEELLAARAS